MTEAIIQPPIPNARNVVFISKATPGDDEFALWLAPRLEAEGYTVFADILSLDGGTRWRKEVTSTLQNRSIKMLLCCRDATLASEGVGEEIGIAADLVKELNDPKFIIPLRLEPFKKLFGIGELQYVDFVRGWAEGLSKLLDTLKRQDVPRDTSGVQINPNWEAFRLRGAIPLKDEPERLTSNWLRISQLPDVIRYFEPTGAIDRDALGNAALASPFPVSLIGKGLVSFATVEEMEIAFADVGKLAVILEIDPIAFQDQGIQALSIRGKDASNVFHSMLRQAWETYCKGRGLLSYRYSGSMGFHATKDHAKVGQRLQWGHQGDRRSSMLRNLARGHIWQFGVTALPASWPLPHYKLKSRVLFSPPLGEEAGEPIDDARKQHRLRRSVCKGWRNKQWHGRMMAFVELLSGDLSYIDLPLSPSQFVRLDASPLLFTSPVSTDLPNVQDDAEEEKDSSTLGKPEPEEEP